MNTPPDFKLTYHWAAPTVRPPLHYEYTITIGPGALGEIDYRPDYPNHNPPQWVEKFEIEPATLNTLASLLDSRHVFDGTWNLRSPSFVGGEQAWLDATANGKQASVPAGLTAGNTAKIQPVYNAVRALVPQGIWDKLEAQRQAYISSQSH